MDCFYIKHESVLEQVSFDSVLWVKADGNYSIIHADGKEFILKTPLRRTLAQLPEELFLQIHRSYFVAIKQIKQVDFVNNQITIDEEQLPIGKSFRENISARLHILK